MKWLDEQSKGSVVYVSLGNRTETRREQIKDMALGLIECGYGFLWVVKLKRVDKEDEEGLEEVLGSELSSKVKEKGVVVYDFMENGSLDKHLFDEPETILSWEQRFKVIKDVASALLYLHEGYEQVVIHRDVKASNVLLDGELNGRLGDFGLSS